MSAPAEIRPLFVTNSLAHGGAERHAITLMNGLGERGQECHAVFIKNERAQITRISLPGGDRRIHCLDARRYFDFPAVQRFAALLRDLQPSIVIATNEYSLLYATLANRRAGIKAPLVVTYHSTRLKDLKEHLKMTFYRLLFWQAHCSVFVCDNQRRFWLRRAVFSRRNEVIFNGVDTDHFAPRRTGNDDSVSRESLGLGGSDFVIGIAARLRPEKNHLQLVDAVKHLRTRGIPARALLIGDGDSRDSIVDHARRLGVGDHLIVTGFQLDVRPYLAICDTVVLCSTTEAFSLAALEAMALGKPFVHSDVGGASEMIYSGWNGYLFPVGDTDKFVAKLGMLANRERARVMGANARQIVESRFSERRMIDHYEQLLRDLLTSAGQRLQQHPAPGNDRHIRRDARLRPAKDTFMTASIGKLNEGGADRRRSDKTKPTVLLLSPALDAVSGVSFHASTLLNSALTKTFDMRHFQIGSEGRQQSRASRTLRLLADPVRLLRRIRRDGVDAVHINSSLNRDAFWRDLLFLFVLRLHRTPVVYQVHGGAMPQDFFRGRRMLTGFLRGCLKSPSRVVVLGSRQLAACRRLLPLREITVIPNAIDCAQFAGLRSRSALQRRRLQLLYLGRLANGKGLCELLHGLASSTLPGSRPQLTIAGSGPEEHYLRTLARDLGLGHDVRFTGPVFGDDKRVLLEQADIFVLPSYSEGLPYALLEAMAAGAAVITTPVGAVPDVVIDGVHGLLIPPRDTGAISDAIRKLHADRPQLEAMGLACRKRALLHYDIARLERDFGEAYRAVSGGNGAALSERMMRSQHS
jgi:glycosyltransferase involved in cell wall biosynthesis